jgi:hypothetical protein
LNTTDRDSEDGDQVMAQRSLMGRVEDLEQARRLMQKLQNRGVDADAVRLAGPGAAQAAADVQDEKTRRAVDQRAVGHVARRVTVGALVGGLIGAALGAVAGAIVLALYSGPGSIVLFVVLVLAVATIGGWAGSFFSVEGSVGYDEAWELTFDQPGEGRDVWLGVRVDDPHVRELAEAAFREEHVVNVVERDSSPLTPSRTEPIRREGDG